MTINNKSPIILHELNNSHGKYIDCIIIRIILIFISLFIGGQYLFSYPDAQLTALPSRISSLSSSPASLLLPGIGAVLYVRTAYPEKRPILAAISASVCGLLFIFFMLTSGLNPSGIESNIILFLMFLYPIVLFFLIPAWFTISYADKPRRIPRILAVLPPIFCLLFLFLYFQFPGCPVGVIYPASSPLVTPFFFGAATIVSIILGILLLYRALTQPEIEEYF